MDCLYLEPPRGWMYSVTPGESLVKYCPVWARIVISQEMFYFYKFSNKCIICICNRLHICYLFHQFLVKDRG